MNYKVKTTFSKARIETFYRFHFLKKSVYRYIEIGLVSALILLSIIGFIFQNTYLIVVPIVLAIVTVLTRKYRIVRSVDRMLKKNPPKTVPYYVSISDTCVRYNQDDVEKIYRIEDIKCLCEIDICFYFYVSENIAIIYPKYNLKLEEKEEIRNLFREKNKFKQYKFISSVDKEGVV